MHTDTVCVRIYATNAIILFNIFRLDGSIASAPLDGRAIILIKFGFSWSAIRIIYVRLRRRVSADGKDLGGTHCAAFR